MGRFLSVLSARRRGTFVAALVVFSSALVPHANAADPQLPNLTPLKPFDIQLEFADDFDFTKPHEALRFSTSSFNSGEYPLELLGAPPEGASRTVANQCVQWNDRVCTARQPAGHFDFHASHGHWHLDDFALYELRRLTKKGKPDMTERGLVATSGKVSFCMMDTANQGEADPADPFDSTGFYVSCSGVFQGISAGWADIYTWDLPGQQILVENVPDGDYALVITSNASEQLLETSYEDNTSVAKIRLGTPPVCMGRTVEVIG